MTDSRYNPTVLEEVLGAVTITATMVSSPLIRPWYSRWGATESDIKGTLPGDDLVPDPVLVSNRAITIQAPNDAVWPWLLQLGQGRGGFYSFQRLENIVGCDIQNVDRILPELQDLKIGDLVRLGPEGMPAFDVAAIEPISELILRGDIINSNTKPTIWIWAFYLKDLDNQTSRLILRTRLDYEVNFANVLMWRLLTDPLSFNMERKMLQGIKERAEASVTKLRA